MDRTPPLAGFWRRRLCAAEGKPDRGEVGEVQYRRLNYKRWSPEDESDPPTPVRIFPRDRRNDRRIGRRGFGGGRKHG